MKTDFTPLPHYFFPITPHSPEEVIKTCEHGPTSLEVERQERVSTKFLLKRNYEQRRQRGVLRQQAKEGQPLPDARPHTQREETDDCSRVLFNLASQLLYETFVRRGFYDPGKLSAIILH